MTSRRPRRARALVHLTFASRRQGNALLAPSSRARFACARVFIVIESGSASSARQSCTDARLEQPQRPPCVCVPCRRQCEPDCLVHHCRPHDVILERREHLGVERLHAIRSHLRTTLPERNATVELHDLSTVHAGVRCESTAAQRANPESRYGESCRANAAGCRGTCVAAQKSRERGRQPSKRLPRAAAPIAASYPT
jgi:hypothetical protein